VTVDDVGEVGQSIHHLVAPSVLDDRGSNRVGHVAIGQQLTLEVISDRFVWTRIAFDPLEPKVG